jgi:hypothetical protein
VALFIDIVCFVVRYFKTKTPQADPPPAIAIESTSVVQNVELGTDDEIAPTLVPIQVKEDLSPSCLHLDRIPVIVEQQNIGSEDDKAASSTTGVDLYVESSSSCFEVGSAIQQEQEDEVIDSEQLFGGRRGDTPTLYPCDSGAVDVRVPLGDKFLARLGSISIEESSTVSEEEQSTLVHMEESTMVRKMLQKVEAQEVEVLNVEVVDEEAAVAVIEVSREEEEVEMGIVEEALVEEDALEIVEDSIKHGDDDSENGNPLTDIPDHDDAGKGQAALATSFPYFDPSLEWDDSCLVDDREVEAGCLTFSFGTEDGSYASAARKDVQHLLNGGVDVKALGVQCVVIEEEGKDWEELEEELDVAMKLFDATFEEDRAICLESGDEEEEEEEVANELLAGLVDEIDESFSLSAHVPSSPYTAAVSIPAGAPQEVLVEENSFDMMPVLQEFYGVDGTKQELLVNTPAPNFDLADVDAVYEDFSPLPCSTSHVMMEGSSTVVEIDENSLYLRAHLDGPDGMPQELFSMPDLADVHDYLSPHLTKRRSDKLAIPLCSSSRGSSFKKRKNTGDDDDSFDLHQVLDEFYGLDGTKQELLMNVEPPDFGKADIIDIYGDFDPCR